MLSSTWLSHWSTVTSEDPHQARVHLWYYLGVYASLGLAFALCETVAAFIMSWGRY